MGNVMSAWIRGSSVLLVLLLGPSSGHAASWADAMFTELSKDFGSVPRGPTLSHQFKVKNTTGQQVVISSVRVSCGCVSASAQKTLLQPGEETYIMSQMDTTRFTGIKTVTIYVNFSAPAYEEVRLWVQADGRNDFMVTPDSLHFGVVKKGSEPTANTTVTFYGRLDAQIVEVRTESSYIKATATELHRRGTEVAYQLSATMRNDVPVGRWYSDIWVTTNLAGMSKIRVPLTIEIESPLSVSPEILILGPVKVDETAERRVIVRGVKPFQIVRVEGTGSELLVRESRPGEREVHVLSVAVTSNTAGKWERKLRIVTDLEAEKMIDFQVQVDVTE